MDIPSKQVYDVLMQKGVTHLFHANSVKTACQFIKHRSLLSRGTVERLDVSQTPQNSDDSDKRYGVWFDVFMDSVDIHDRANRANLYGPVLFKLKTEIIKKTYAGRLWVTKLNPTKWAGMSEKERWFQDKSDLEQNFVVGRFDQMIVVRHCGGQLPFGNFVKKIVLDDPNRSTHDDVDVYSMAVGSLRLAMEEAGVGIMIERRACRTDCSCEEFWGADDDRLFEMYDALA